MKGKQAQRNTHIRGWSAFDWKPILYTVMIF